MKEAMQKPSKPTSVQCVKKKTSCAGIKLTKHLQV